MKASLNGLIINSASLLEQSGGNGLGYAYMLKEMKHNLDEAIKRYTCGDSTGIDEFIDLYCLKTSTPTPRPPTPAP